MTLGTGRENLRPARVRHHAERAELAAAFHDGNVGAWADPRCGAGSRSNFSISGKLTSTSGIRPRAASAEPLRAGGISRSIHHFRQAVQRLRAKHDVHERARAATIASPSWLATQPPTPISAPADWPALCAFPPAELAEHLLRRLLANGAGVEEQHVRLRRDRPPRTAPWLAPQHDRPSAPSRTRSSGSRGFRGRASQPDHCWKKRKKRHHSDATRSVPVTPSATSSS